MKKNVIIGLITLLTGAVAFSLAVAGPRSLAWLGVYTQNVDADIADEYSLKSDYGAIVDEIIENSPAEKAGVKEDDIIVAFNDNKVRDDDDLTDLVHDSKPGDTVTLTLIRDGKEQKIQVELGRRPRNSDWWDDMKWFDAPHAAKLPRPPLPPRAYSYHYEEHPYIGVTMVELSEDAAQALGAEKGAVLVDEVKRNSPAEKAGLKPGDLIVAADGKDVYEAEDVREIVEDKDEGDTVSLSIVRARQKMTVEVKVELSEDSDFFGRSGVIRIPDLTDANLLALDAYGRALGHARHGKISESDEYRLEMKEFEHSMRKLKEDLGEMKKSLH